MKRKSDATDDGATRRKPFRSIANARDAWRVQWRNPQHRKHKTWEGDGILVVSNSLLGNLFDSDGTLLSTSKVAITLGEGVNVTVGGKEIEVEGGISLEDFQTGACFGLAGPVAGPSTVVASSKPSRKGTSFKPPLMVSRSENDAGSVSQSSSDMPDCHWTINWRKPTTKKNKTWDGDGYLSLVDHKLTMLSDTGKPMGTIPWKGQSLHSGLSLHINGKELELDSQISADELPGASGGAEEDPYASVQAQVSEKLEKFISPLSFYSSKPKAGGGPLHDPAAPDAVVMKAPTKEHQKRFNKRNLDVVPVVIDPILARKMRDHQKEGVKFLYECVMGLRKHEGQGCVLADEMGLGKTLQTIALIWTLLKQNPYAAPLPTVQKVLIVCPVSLTNNWKNEFHKWLGRDRVGVLVCNKGNIDLFASTSRTYQVLIIGYERVRTLAKKLSTMHPPIGLIVCDEGHRLKSASSKTSKAFQILTCPRRVILSGTPIQNDLQEFHTMAEFCNPGLLDEYSVFRKTFELPILRSRAQDATEKEIATGNEKKEQLLMVARSFVLRRDASLLKNHLPPKSEFVVFVTPTKLQLAMFDKILSKDHVDDLVHNSTAETLAMITTLMKISNSPVLLKATLDKEKKQGDGQQRSHNTPIAEAVSLLSERVQATDITLSGKLTVLDQMLRLIHKETDEKCVIVSHYTSTLNILEAYCRARSFAYYRLDGQTPQNKRQEYVNAFNRGSKQSSYIFLLSSKAGGVGINLIGASRLFLLDSDWNPSHDLQSMARCHRDGQKRPVFIYRLLTAGTIDEKIYQRQVTKIALSDSLIGSGSDKSKTDSFTRKDLLDIFRVDPHTGSSTHDLLECNCDTDGDSKSVDGSEEAEQDIVLPSPRKGFKFASDITPEEQDGMDKAYAQKKREGLASLSEWKHINCLVPTAPECVYDSILRQVVSNIHQIIPSSDKEEDQPMAVNISDVPGGTISFLFQKCKQDIFEDSCDSTAEDK